MPLKRLHEIGNVNGPTLVLPYNDFFLYAIKFANRFTTKELFDMERFYYEAEQAVEESYGYGEPNTDLSNISSPEELHDAFKQVEQGELHIDEFQGFVLLDIAIQMRIIIHLALDRKNSHEDSGYIHEVVSKYLYPNFDFRMYDEWLIENKFHANENPNKGDSTALLPRYIQSIYGIFIKPESATLEGGSKKNRLAKPTRKAPTLPETYIFIHEWYGGKPK